MNKFLIKRAAYKTSTKTKRTINKVNNRVETSSFIGKLSQDFFKYIILIIFGFIVLFPFYYMLSMSLMTRDEIATPPSDGNPNLFPEEFQWWNYFLAFGAGYWSAFLFSTMVMAVNIVFKVFVCVLLGYAFGNFNFKFKNGLWSIFMITLMIPEIAIISGQYWTVGKLNIDEGILLLLSISGPFIASIFTAYMFRNAFEQIPNSVKEAALIDGCSKFSYFSKVALPMVKSTIWTVIILTAFASWNSYMWPNLLLAANPNLSTIPIWLFQVGNDLQELGESQFQPQIQMAGAVIAIIPTFIFYLIFKNKINSTVAGGSATKG